jgi:hypothetical protein
MKLSTKTLMILSEFDPYDFELEELLDWSFSGYPVYYYSSGFYCPEVYFSFLKP